MNSNIYKYFILLFIFCSLYSLNACAKPANLGAKYGFSYIDDFDKGKTYSGILYVPLYQTYGFEVEYGKFKDDDGFVDGKYTGLYLDTVLWNLFELPFNAKIGIVNLRIKYDEPYNNLYDSGRETKFSFGIGTGINTPYFSGVIEYLQISEEVHSIAAVIKF